MELTTEEIEANKMIAKVMGWRFSNPEMGQPYRLYMPGREDWVMANWILEDFNESANEKFVVYQVRWESLMQVVEKIEAIEDDYHGHFGVYISSNSCTIQATKFRPDKPIPDPPHYFSEHYGNSKIQATWLAVVAFFQWYNSLPSIDTNLIKKNKEG